MPSSVVVASTWSASRAEILAAHLRSLGFDAFSKSHLDRTTYGGELGGASVLVPAEQGLEAEFELVQFDRHEADLPPEPDLALGPDLAPDEPEHGPRRRWVRPAGYLAVAAMVLGAVVPSLTIIWSRLAG